jgi:hypothetical protein
MRRRLKFLSEFPAHQRSANIPLIGKGVEELRGEATFAIVADAVYPSACRRRLRWTVVRRVDLNRGEVVGDIGEWVESARRRLRIHDAFPIRVFPSCGTNTYHTCTYVSVR